MAGRRERVERLLGLRERALETARAALAAEQRAVQQAAEARTAAEREWTTRAAAVALARFTDVDELMEAHAHIAALRRRADLAAERLAAATAKEEAARGVCMRAERERKKLEIWRDRLVMVERQAESRRERIATDEVAARTYGRSHG